MRLAHDSPRCSQVGLVSGVATLCGQAYGAGERALLGVVLQVRTHHLTDRCAAMHATAARTHAPPLLAAGAAHLTFLLVLSSHALLPTQRSICIALVTCLPSLLVFLCSPWLLTALGG
jgi:hypothetical protein